jgi:RNA polymerase sigma-70 factor (ECF subfamily)
LTDPREPPWLAEVVARLQAGALAEDDFSRLVDLYEGRLMGFFAALGENRDDAREFTQDTFLRVFKSIREFRSDSTFTYWLFSIAKNVWKNDLRRRGAAKRKRPELPLEPEPPEEWRPPPRPAAGVGQVPPEVEERLAARDDRRRVAVAVAQLPERLRRVVVLRFGHDLKYREIAERLDIPIDTVKSQLHYALERLRPLLEREGPRPQP